MGLISKSSYIRGIKCNKALYLHFKNPELQDEINQQQQNIFNIGHNIGYLAQQVFSGGIDASRGEPGNIQSAINYTRELIDAGQEVIYEAAFTDGENLCYLDILVKRDGLWHGIEVKATTEVKDYHNDDVAFQYFVITRAGLPLADISLMHINNQYIRRGALDLNQLFISKNLTPEILLRQEQVAVNLQLLREMLAAGIEPAIDTGTHCSKPYDCDFIGYCNQNSTLYPLCDVQGINQSKAKKLHDMGIQCFEDIPEDFRFTDREWELAESELKGLEIRDDAALSEFRKGLEYPLYYLDFETIMPAVPMYNENRPYQQIPFQYSLHIQQTAEGEITHYEWLGNPPSDPRPEFIESLLRLMGTSGTIVTYNMVFERSRLEELARDFPHYAVEINALILRISDLMVPFKKRWLYRPAMKGSYSIKAVLPAYVNDVSYLDLEIQQGGAASLTYLTMYDEPDPEIISTKRTNLLKYCHLDTLAMVKLMEVVYAVQ